MTDIDQVIKELAAAHARIAELEQRDREREVKLIRDLDNGTFKTFKTRAADALADEVAVLVRRKVIDMRSPAADALLSYRSPPSTERADRMAELERMLSAESVAVAMGKVSGPSGFSEWPYGSRLHYAEKIVAALRPLSPRSGAPVPGMVEVGRVAAEVMRLDAAYAEAVEQAKASLRTGRGVDRAYIDQGTIAVQRDVHARTAAPTLAAFVLSLVGDVQPPEGYRVTVEEGVASIEVFIDNGSREHDVDVILALGQADATRLAHAILATLAAAPVPGGEV